MNPRIEVSIERRKWAGLRRSHIAIAIQSGQVTSPSNHALKRSFVRSLVLFLLIGECHVLRRDRPKWPQGGFRPEPRPRMTRRPIRRGGNITTTTWPCPTFGKLWWIDKPRIRLLYGFRWNPNRIPGLRSSSSFGGLWYRDYCHPRVARPPWTRPTMPIGSRPLSWIHWSPLLPGEWVVKRK